MSPKDQLSFRLFKLELVEAFRQGRKAKLAVIIFGIRMSFVVLPHIVLYYIIKLYKNYAMSGEIEKRESLSINGFLQNSGKQVNDVLEIISSKIDQVKGEDDLIKAVEYCLLEVVDNLQKLYLFRIKNTTEAIDLRTNRLYDISNSTRCIAKEWRVINLKSSDWLVLSKLYPLKSKVIIFPVFKNSKLINGLLFTMEVPQNSQVPSNILTFLHLQTRSCYKRLCKRTLSVSQEGVYKDLSCLLHLCGDLNERDPLSMQLKLVSYIAERTGSKSCCLLLVSNEMGQLMCQVSNNKIHEFDCVFPINEGFFATVCENKKVIIIDDVTKQNTWDLKSFNSLFEEEIRSCLIVPVISQSTQEVVGVVCASNKLHNDKFTMDDADLVTVCLQHTWTVLTSALALKKERKAKDEFRAMLNIARNLFTRLDDVTVLLSQIIQEARDLTSAERCSVFLVDNESQELVAKVFDGISSMDESLDPRQYDFEGMNEVRLPLSQGIAGHVATTGRTLNIKDAYSHPLFYSGIDETTGFKTRNILCFPIKDHNGVVVGVSQLCNKINGSYFTTYDEELASHFSIFSGISISHSLLYKQVIESNCRSQLANELMTYHMKASNIEVEQCLSKLPSSVYNIHPQFDQFIFPPRTLAPHWTIPATVAMYTDLGLTSRFHISLKTLSRFVIMVHRGYRDPPYHNWDHAFSVAHHAYLLAKNLDLCNVIGPLETLALLTGSLCHDLDHRGTNNAFQVSSQSVLAALYSSEGSVLEHHHFAQAMSILNIGNCNIFESLTKKEYVRVLDLVKNIILATDLGHHLKILHNLEDMATESFNPSSCTEEEKENLIALLMTSSDISDQTKDWETTKSTAKLIYKEFFSQGDMERSMGTSPALTNDRERACVPELQINFMKHIAMPVYRILTTIFPQYKDTYIRFEDNLSRWVKVEQEFKALGLPIENSLDFLTEDFDNRLFHQ